MFGRCCRLRNTGLGSRIPFQELWQELDRREGIRCTLPPNRPTAVFLIVARWGLIDRRA
jgi:hypothetical protein